jgi:hypothetical protein
MFAADSAKQRLEFTAHEFDSHNKYPSHKYPYKVQFWRRDDGKFSVRWAPPRSTDGVVMAGIGTAKGQVPDIVEVAFYPVVGQSTFLCHECVEEGRQHK